MPKVLTFAKEESQPYLYFINPGMRAIMGADAIFLEFDHEHGTEKNGVRADKVVFQAKNIAFDGRKLESKLPDVDGKPLDVYERESRRRWH